MEEFYIFLRFKVSHNFKVISYVKKKITFIKLIKKKKKKIKVILFFQI
jgi:hypothetical protein